MGTQGPHFPSKMGTRVPIIPGKWGPGIPILGDPHFPMTPGWKRQRQPPLGDPNTLTRSQCTLYLVTVLCSVFAVNAEREYDVHARAL